MLTVDDYGRIRRAHRDGMSIREIARTFHHSRHKIRKILHGDQAEPAKYARRGSQSAPKLGLFHDRILEILKLDETAPPRQRHTAMRIFERLRDDEGYVGQYDAIRRFVKKDRESKRETFIPLDHAAGQRVEADFGEISVDFPDGRRKVNVLILVWSYSNAPFATLARCRNADVPERAAWRTVPPVCRSRIATGRSRQRFLLREGRGDRHGTGAGTPVNRGPKSNCCHS